MNRLERDEIVRAVRAAEAGNTGELRVVLPRRCHVDALDAAREAFAELGMERTRGRTGVLILFCERDHKMAILGDAGIHAHVGQEFWAAVIRLALGHAHEGEPLRALLTAIDEVGKVFRRYLPAERGEGNELPDEPHTD